MNIYDSLGERREEVVGVRDFDAGILRRRVTDRLVISITQLGGHGELGQISFICSEGGKEDSGIFFWFRLRVHATT